MLRSTKAVTAQHSNTRFPNMEKLCAFFNSIFSCSPEDLFTNVPSKLVSSGEKIVSDVMSFCTKQKIKNFQPVQGNKCA